MKSLSVCSLDDQMYIHVHKWKLGILIFNLNLAKRKTHSPFQPLAPFHQQLVRLTERKWSEVMRCSGACLEGQLSCLRP